MRRSRRVNALTAFLLLFSYALCVSDVQAQTCGFGFRRFEVSDSTGKTIPDVMIELAGELTFEDYLELRTKLPYRDITGPHLKLLPQDAEELIKRITPPSKTKDYCGDPLKQRINSTEVKTGSNTEARRMNFGFCTFENDITIFMLKISAPSYMADYYVGRYLSGCRADEKIILSKLENKKKSS